ncbi:MAG: hypothetical protein KQH79_14070 [Bacteroidetes bacterium]|nr:hypothetical protein [Bacteroidota bacterium]
MTRLELLQRISKIHAIKCNKSLSDKDAIDSFNTLNEFRSNIETGVLKDIEARINKWQSESPVASNYEIELLLTK